MLTNFFNRVRATTEREPTAEPSETASGDLRQVVMYSTTWCGGCRAAKRYFAERGITYEEIDSECVAGAAKNVMAWANGNKTVPTMVIGNKVVVDWRQKLVEDALVSEGILQEADTH